MEINPDSLHNSTEPQHLRNLVAQSRQQAGNQDEEQQNNGRIEQPPPPFNDPVQLSDQARQLQNGQATPGFSPEETAGAQPVADETTPPAPENNKTGSNSSGLTEEEQEVVRELASRDRVVRAHEAAHAAVGGQYAGSPSFSYEHGPDGRRYAVGGEVSIDTSPVQGDPVKTAQKAQTIQKAALAPAEPSPADRSIAAKAALMAAKAQAETLQNADEASPTQSPDTGPDKNNSENSIQGTPLEAEPDNDADDRQLQSQPLDTASPPEFPGEQNTPREDGPTGPVQTDIGFDRYGMPQNPATPQLLNRFA